MSDTKHCNRCGQDKPADGDHWYFRRGRPDAPCKECQIEKVAVRRRENPEKVREICRKSARKRQASDPERFRAYKRKYREANREKIRQSEKKRRDANPDKVLASKKKYRDANRERLREYHREKSRVYQAANAEKLREKSKIRMRKSRSENPDKFRDYWREYHKIRSTDPHYRLSNSVSRSIWKALSKRSSRKSLPKALITGWTIDELIAHLTPLFEEGMSFDNYGEWHIDHIVPLASIPYTKETDPGFRRAWALSNLAPLWAIDNLTKNARTDWVLPDSYRNPLLRAVYANADWKLAA